MHTHNITLSSRTYAARYCHATTALFTRASSVPVTCPPPHGAACARTLAKQYYVPHAHHTRTLLLHTRSPRHHTHCATPHVLHIHVLDPGLPFRTVTCLRAPHSSHPTHTQQPSAILPAVTLPATHCAHRTRCYTHTVPLPLPLPGCPRICAHCGAAFSVRTWFFGRLTPHLCSDCAAPLDLSILHLRFWVCGATTPHHHGSPHTCNNSPFMDSSNTAFPLTHRDTYAFRLPAHCSSCHRSLHCCVRCGAALPAPRHRTRAARILFMRVYVIDTPCARSPRACYLPVAQRSG